MRIGIITFVEGNCNFGGVFQSVALQDFLRGMGCEPALLRIRYNKSKPFILSFLERPAKAVLERTKARRFAPFKARHIPTCGLPVYELRSFLGNPPAFDAFVCGSDQIWNPGFLEDEAKRNLFFLNFGPDSVRRVAYAASWGAAEIARALQAAVRPLIRRLDAVSVREKSGVALAAELGVDAAWLPDPTLLHPDSYWNALADKTPRQDSEPTLFRCAYRWTPRVPFEKVERLIQEKNPLRTVIPFSNRPFHDRAMTKCLAPEEWLAAMRDASFVLANSYHATLFSIIFRRPFLVIPLAGKYAGMNERIYSITERLGLEDRIVDSADDARIRAQVAALIDWDAVEHKLDPWRAEARSFLANALDLPPAS